MTHFMRMAAALLLAALGTATVQAAVQTVGPYVIHYNTFTADAIAAQVARHYDIPRSSQRAVVNVTVMKKGDEGAGDTRAIAAKVTGKGTNLTQQLKPVQFREIREDKAIYYISHFPVANAEVVDFELTVEPEGSEEPINIGFRRQFFTTD